MSMTPYSDSKDQADASTRVLRTQGTGTSGDVKQEVADKAGEVLSQTQEKAGEVVDQVKQQATTQIDTQKGRASDALGSVALAIRQTGTQLHEQDNAQIAQYADKAAQQVENLANYLRNTDISQMAAQVERLARRQPALFLGGALALGLFGARFLKSSSQQAQGQSWQGYSGDYPSRGSMDYSGSNTGGYSYSGTSTARNPYIGRSYDANYDQSQGYDQGSVSDGDSSGGSNIRERTWTGTSLEES